MNRTHFGLALRHIRQEAGLTIEEMSAIIGISYSYCSMIEGGHRYISRDKAEVLLTRIKRKDICFDLEAMLDAAELDSPKVDLRNLKTDQRAEVVHLVRRFREENLSMPPEARI